MFLWQHKVQHLAAAGAVNASLGYGSEIWELRIQIFEF